MTEANAITFEDIQRARERLEASGVVKSTPLIRPASLEAMTEAEALFVKLEHLQRTGSFKPRGAYNKIQSLLEAGDIDHVIAASAGNHAQGVALAATELGVKSTVVMPKTAPQTKVEATRNYGADVELVGKDFRRATEHALELAEQTNGEFVHAFDDPDIVAGQGTLGVEMYEHCSTVDTVIVPIGGGGLISGIATAFAELSPETRIIGVQATGAQTVIDSLDKGVPQSLNSVDTIADGIATGGISELTFSIIKRHVDEVMTVTDAEIVDAILLLMERAKQVVEGAGAASVAALLRDELDVTDETVMPLLCGGNLDMTMLNEVVVHALTRRRQILRLRVQITDQPGKMAEISGIIADHDANIQTVQHDRALQDLSIGEAYLTFQIETSGAEQAAAIVDSVADAGYDVGIVN